MIERASTLISESVPGGTAHTIEVSGISEVLLRRLDQRARDLGSDRSTVIRDIIASELGGEEMDISPRGFDAALAPLRAGFSDSGMSEEEAESLLDAGLRAVRAERRQAASAQGGAAARVSDRR